MWPLALQQCCEGIKGRYYCARPITQLGLRPHLIPIAWLQNHGENHFTLVIDVNNIALPKQKNAESVQGASPEDEVRG